MIKVKIVKKVRRLTKEEIDIQVRRCRASLRLAIIWIAIQVNCLVANKTGGDCPDSSPPTCCALNG